MSQAGLNLFFNPSSIAVIGASRTPTKIGYETLKKVPASFVLRNKLPMLY